MDMRIPFCRRSRMRFWGVIISSSWVCEARPRAAYCAAWLISWTWKFPTLPDARFTTIRSRRYLGDELTIHFGLLPRANRGIFAVNELPGLAGKMQGCLFNMMQEGDI